MNINDYQKEAMKTLNPELNKKDILINSVMGLCGESGEAIDIVKKWLMQGHDLDEYSANGRPLVTVEKSTQYAKQVHLTKKLNTVGSPF